MARLCELPRTRGLGANRDEGRTFRSRSERKRPAAGAGDGPDAPTRTAEARVVL